MLWKESFTWSITRCDGCRMYIYRLQRWRFSTDEKRLVINIYRIWWIKFFVFSFDSIEICNISTVSLKELNRCYNTIKKNSPNSDAPQSIPIKDLIVCFRFWWIIFWVILAFFCSLVFVIIWHLNKKCSYEKQLFILRNVLMKFVIFKVVHQLLLLAHQFIWLA